MSGEWSLWIITPQHTSQQHSVHSLCLNCTRDISVSHQISVSVIIQVCHLIFFLYEQLVFFTDVVMILLFTIIVIDEYFDPKMVCFFASIYAVCFLYDWNHNISDLMHNSESVWISVMVKTM